MKYIVHTAINSDLIKKLRNSKNLLLVLKW